MRKTRRRARAEAKYDRIEAERWALEAARNAAVKKAEGAQEEAQKSSETPNLTEHQGITMSLSQFPPLMTPNLIEHQGVTMTLSQYYAIRKDIAAVPPTA